MGVMEKLEEWSDPRTKGYPLIDSPLQAFVVLAAYVLFCTWIGPAFMRKRQPLKLEKIIQVYNLVQVISCSIFAVFASYVVINARVSIFCHPLTRSEDYWIMKITRYHWYYFLFKIFDCMDTVFFVLRKKNNHISFLHLYHHIGMYVMSWMMTKFFPGAPSCLTGILNTCVHVCMYGYYYIASLGPEYRKYLWWKRYITQLQILQFLTIFVQGVIGLRFECGVPKYISLLFVTQSLTFVYLFGKFYINTYIKVKKSPIYVKKK